MLAGPGICDAISVKPEPRLLAALAALLLPLIASGAGNFTIPKIRLYEPGEPPTVSVTIPRYALTPAERETVAACLVLEAASQGDTGMRAVMAVIRNRSRGLPELFAATVLREKQFSALNTITMGQETLSHAVLRARRDRTWSTALAIVDEAVEDNWRDPTYGATHYTRSVETTRWTRSLAKTVTIGAHSFYR
jgi:spore germination cell wall hydrolase CwlJ-like protein